MTTFDTGLFSKITNFVRINIYGKNNVISRFGSKWYHKRR